MDSGRRVTSDTRNKESPGGGGSSMLGRCWALGKQLSELHGHFTVSPHKAASALGLGKLRACERGAVRCELLKMLSALRGYTVPLLNGLRGRLFSLGHGCDSDRSTNISGHMWAVE